MALPDSPMMFNIFDIIQHTSAIFQFVSANSTLYYLSPLLSLFPAGEHNAGLLKWEIFGNSGP